MRIIKQLEDIRETEACALALGTFDGLHPGHQAVIRAAAESPFAVGVFTFDSVPSGNPAVVTAEDRERLFQAMGVERLYSLEFASLKNMEPERFFREVLLERCRARKLCCGGDFRFGRAAAGNVALLTQLCGAWGVELQVVPAVLENGEKISSTRIRTAIQEGDIPLANRLLGRPFGFALEVIHGNHLGTGLGIPTINQALPENFALPKFGVYATWVQVEDVCHYGVTNVGVKPTVGSDRVLSETWLPEFSGDLYGKQVRLYFLRFIRPERKFDSLEDLKAEIVRNAAEAKKIAEKNPIEPGKSLYNRGKL